jgi:putative hemolysin
MDIAHALFFTSDLGLLLCFSAFFSGSETALCALSRVQVERLRSDLRKSSRAIVNFVDNPRRLFITILLGNVFVNMAFATVTAEMIYSLFTPAATAPEAGITFGTSGLAVTIATVVITFLLLVFGEVTPKTFAINHAEGFARFAARPLWGFSVLITPLRAVLRGITNSLLPLFGGGEMAGDDHVTADDFRAAVDSHRESVLHSDEHEMLDRILELQEIEANEIMVPRTEMIAMNVTSTIQEVLNKAKAVGFSRIPLYRDQIDNICGISHVKDMPLWRGVIQSTQTIAEFLESSQGETSTTLANTLVRQPFFAYESVNLTNLFPALTRAKTKIAILLDEYGGVAGSVTTEDIIEEIVGDIFDEHDHGHRLPHIEVDPHNPSVIRLAGRTSVREVNKRFHLKINEAIADSIGGYALSLFGRIPAAGESIFDDDGIRFEVVAMAGKSITSAVMTLPPHEAPAPPRTAHG